VFTEAGNLEFCVENGLLEILGQTEGSSGGTLKVISHIS
jgi:hypothetical protein